ncbi:hypothetical protein ASE82_08490 [Sphingomonas sp. Leaf230]|nr:hypothetical protein ASE82_08490 [Sphingomonas sp. Leaf230]
MSWDAVSDTVCPIARSLSVVGDRWTMLILRELVMGVRRFDEIQAQTGMSSNLLSVRLKRLETDGVIERRAYSERPKRYEYYATEKGKELDPILLLLRSWGTKWGGYAEDEDLASELVHKETGERVHPEWRPPANGNPFSFDDVDATLSPAFEAERAARRTAFQNGKRSVARGAQ